MSDPTQQETPTMTETKTMEGLLGKIAGIPIIESKAVREGTYMCFDKDGNPIKASDLGSKQIAKIMVHDVETFKIALKHNEES